MAGSLWSEGNRKAGSGLSSAESTRPRGGWCRDPGSLRKIPRKCAGHRGTAVPKKHRGAQRNRLWTPPSDRMACPVAGHPVTGAGEGRCWTVASHPLLFPGMRALFAVLTRLIGVGAAGRTAVGAGRLLLAAAGRLGRLAGTAAAGTALFSAALCRTALFRAAGGAAGSRLAAGGLSRAARSARRAALRILRTAGEPRIGLGGSRAVGHRVADPHEGGERQSETERLESRHGNISEMVWDEQKTGRTLRTGPPWGRAGRASAEGGAAGPA